MPTPQPFMHKDKIEVGLDEAGRGPCFGRLYTAGVIWPIEVTSAAAPLVRDSKTLNWNQIQQAYKYVTETAVEWHVTYAEHSEVDQYGPLKADMRSLHRCLDKFQSPFQHILMDGNYFKPDYVAPGEKVCPCTTVVKGDAHYLSIAAASIIAKYTRDKYILDLCLEYPLFDTRYDLAKNKGYFTAKHKLGVQTHGISEFHRVSYKCCKDQSVSVITHRSQTQKIRPIIKLKTSVLQQNTYLDM